MSLQDRAIEALEHSRAADDFERRRWFEEQKEAAAAPFSNRFGTEPERVVLGERYSLVIEHEGLRFSFTRHSGEIHLLRQCPLCRQEAASPDVRDLARLGALLYDFSLFSHACALAEDGSLRSELHKLADAWADQAGGADRGAQHERRLRSVLATALPFGVPRPGLKRAS